LRGRFRAGPAAWQGCSKRRTKAARACVKPGKEIFQVLPPAGRLPGSGSPAMPRHRLFAICRLRTPRRADWPVANRCA